MIERDGANGRKERKERTWKTSSFLFAIKRAEMTLVMGIIYDGKNGIKVSNVIEMERSFQCLALLRVWLGGAPRTGLSNLL